VLYGRGGNGIVDRAGKPYAPTVIQMLPSAPLPAVVVLATAPLADTEPSRYNAPLTESRMALPPAAPPPCWAQQPPEGDPSATNAPSMRNVPATSNFAAPPPPHLRAAATAAPLTWRRYGVISPTWSGRPVDLGSTEAAVAGTPTPPTTGMRRSVMTKSNRSRGLVK